MRKIIFVLVIFSTIMYSCSTIPTVKISKNFLLENNENKLLWYYVERHIYDPSDKLFQDIEITFKSFNPDLVLVEGGNNIDSKSSADAIRVGGESRFVSYLGFRAGKIIKDIEPPFNNQIEYLLEKNDIDIVYAMFLIRLLNSDKARYDSGTREINDIYKHCIGYLKYINTISGIEKEINNEYVDRIVKTYFKKGFNDNDWFKNDYYYIIYNPQGALYQLRNQITEFRNIWLVKLIKEQKTKFNRIFVMMGSGHLLSTKKELMEIYN